MNNKSNNIIKDMHLHLKKFIVAAFCFQIASLMRLSSAQQFDYHTDAEIQSRIDELIDQNPQFSKRTCSNSQLYNYLQIGEPSNGTLNAVLVCNIHAREIIASQICVRWIQHLTNDSVAMENYFTRVFYIANSNRQRFIDNQQECIRKNQNGVDTNRNFPTDFDHWHADPSNDTYGGKTPFDQLLSKCINNLFSQLRPDLYIDIHSGMNSSIFYQQGINNEKEIQLINQVNQRICNSELRVTTLAKDGETINGHIFADIKARLNVPFSFLIETYKGPDDQGCFLIFNPTGFMKQVLISRYQNVIDYMFSEVYDNL